MILDQMGYAAPDTLDEAIALLTQDPDSVPLAGGDGLLTLLKRGERHVSAVVDLRSIGELRGVAVIGDGGVRVGALTTLSRMLAEPTVRAAQLPGALGDAILATGDVQARNRATLGGTIASAERGSHLSAALLAIGATVLVAGPVGRRVLPVDGVLSGETPLDRCELIVSVDLAPAEPASAYDVVADRANQEAICGVAVALAPAPDGTPARCRIAVTGALPLPQRLTELEQAAAGPGELPALDPGRFVRSHAASAGFRAHLAGVLTQRALATATARARAR
jgi:aerobic carbon-monoxide dehydrogenase medium subunit